MDLDIILTLAILVVAIVLFVTEWLRVDLVALLVMVVLILVGFVTPGEALAGLSNPAVVTVGAVLVLSARLARTGVANTIGRQVSRVAGENEVRLIVMIMLVAGVMSAFMNDIGVTALLLPVIIGIAGRSGLAPSKLLLPLAFGALLGGLNTLIGTPPNILVSDILRQYGLEPFAMFDYTPVGLPLLVAGIIFMALVGRRLLPTRFPAGALSGRANGENNHRDLFVLEERLALVTIPADSLLAGKTLAESRIGRALGLTILAVQRERGRQRPVTPETILQANDLLLSLGRVERLEALGRNAHLFVEDIPVSLNQLFSADVGVGELKITTASPYCGQTLSQLDLRRKYDLNVLAIRQNGRARRTDLQDIPLQDGDTLLLQGTPADLDQFNAQEVTGTIFHGGLSAAEAAIAYGLQERLLAVRIPEASLLAGRRLADSQLAEIFGLVALGIVRQGQTTLMPGAETVLQAGDVVLVEGDPEDLLIVRELGRLTISPPPGREQTELETAAMDLTEAVLSPYTELVNQTLRQGQFRTRYGLSVLAIWRNDRAYRSDLGDMVLQYGDTLLLYGPRERMRLLARDPGFVVISEEAQEPPRTRKAPLAVAIMAGVLLAVIVGWLHIAVAAIAGAVLMVITGCLDMEEAYSAIEWKAIFLIAGMLSLGVAMEKTGAALFVADGLVSLIGGLGPRAVVAGFFILTTLSTQVMPNPAVAVLLAPIAVNTATDLQMSPYALMMTIAVAASAAFLSPVGHPLNVLVMAPGGYRFTDYLKAGIPLSLVVLVVLLIVLPIFWPLT
jgi:di/tricarboxylate transporter